MSQGRSSATRRLTREQIEAWRSWRNYGTTFDFDAGSFDELCDMALAALAPSSAATFIGNEHHQREVEKEFERLVVRWGDQAHFRNTNTEAGCIANDAVNLALGVLRQRSSIAAFDFAKFEDLVTEYSNATFECGQWEEENGTPYERLNKMARTARERLLSFVRESVAPSSATGEQDK